MSRHRHIDPADIEKARKKALSLWGQGLSTSAIAERVGRKQHTVQVWLRESGVRSESPRHRYDGEGDAGVHHERQPVRFPQ
jgi:transposase-like protein